MGDDVDAGVEQMRLHTERELEGMVFDIAGAFPLVLELASMTAGKLNYKGNSQQRD